MNAHECAKILQIKCYPTNTLTFLVKQDQTELASISVGKICINFYEIL